MPAKAGAPVADAPWYGRRVRARPGIPLLLVAVLVPCAALGTFGAASLVDEASKIGQRYRERAESALDAAMAALEGTAAALPDGVPGARAFAATDSGDLVRTDAAAGPESRESPDGAAGDLFLLVLTEVDRLERANEPDLAAARLRALVESEPPRDVAAAALTALAAVERRAGHEDAANAAWNRIVTEHADARDGRGLKRAFAARLALAGDDPAALAGLFRDVVADDVAAGRPGTSAFRRVVRERAASAVAPAVLADLDARDAAAAPERQLRAALEGGLRAWIASGGRGVRTFGVPEASRAASDPRSDPVRLVVAVRDAAAGGVSLAVAPLDAVVAASLARSEVRALEAVGFRVGVPAAGDDGPVPPRGAGEHLAGARLGIVGSDVAAFRTRERRRLLLTGALAALALLVAAVAAFATLRAWRREQATARERQNFVAAVTHELKAPLASIRLMAEVLAKGGVEDAKVREFADRAIGECDRLSRLVASVLELARIEGAGAQGRLATVDVVALAREVIATFEPVARKHGFTLALRAADAGLEVAGDEDALAGAILNLLDNAVKYADRPGEIELEVAAAGPGHAAFSVLDRGRGVPASESRRIFEPFARLGDEMTRDRPGVGLGLALVSRVAAAHGGSASCLPREGGGSRFTIVLPLRPRTAP
jgi:signal transduction histidine kinase